MWATLIIFDSHANSSSVVIEWRPMISRVRTSNVKTPSHLKTPGRGVSKGRAMSNSQKGNSSLLIFFFQISMEDDLIGFIGHVFSIRPANIYHRSTASETLWGHKDRSLLSLLLQQPLYFPHESPSFFTLICSILLFGFLKFFFLTALLRCSLHATQFT